MSKLISSTLLFLLGFAVTSMFLYTPKAHAGYYAAVWSGCGCICDSGPHCACWRFCNDGCCQCQTDDSQCGDPIDPWLTGPPVPEPNISSWRHIDAFPDAQSLAEAITLCERTPGCTFEIPSYNIEGGFNLAEIPVTRTMKLAVLYR